MGSTDSPISVEQLGFPPPPLNVDVDVTSEDSVDSDEIPPLFDPDDSSSCRCSGSGSESEKKLMTTRNWTIYPTCMPPLYDPDPSIPAVSPTRDRTRTQTRTQIQTPTMTIAMTMI